MSNARPLYRRFSRYYGKRNSLKYIPPTETVTVPSFLVVSCIFYELPPFQTGIAIGVVYLALTKIFSRVKKL